MAGRIIKKNPTKKFQYEKGMEVLAGKQFGDHMAHLRTSVEQAGVAKPGTTASGSKA
jgi:hypothetical protein